MKDKVFQLVKDNASNNAVKKISLEDLKMIIESTEFKLNRELSGYGVIDKPYTQYYDEETLNSSFPHERVSKVLLDKCLEFYDRDVFRVDKKTITYGEFYNNILMCADALKSTGLKKGDIITMCTLSVPESLYMFFAANVLGAIVRPLDPISSPEVIKNTLLKTNSKYFVTLGLNYKNLKEVTKGTSVEKTIYLSLKDNIPGASFIKRNLINIGEKISRQNIKNNSSSWISFDEFIKESSKSLKCKDLIADYEPDEVCAIFSTSGSTGEPKGVCITNENFLCSTYKQYYAGFNVDEKDSIFNPMPTNSSYFWSDILLGCIWGVTNSLNPVFNPDDSPKQIINDGSSVVLLGPIILEKMLEYLDENEKKGKKLDLSHIKYYVSGGDILTLDLEQRFNKKIREYHPTAVVNNALGTSETIGAAFNPNGILKNQDSYMEGSVGVVLPGDDVGIFEYDEEFGLRNINSKNYSKGLLYYDIGEICLNTNNPNVFKEYYKNDEATASTKLTHLDGSVWYHTGDLGYIDPAGHMFCSGRKTGLIVRSGHKVWAKKIENVISKIDGVVDCSIIGVPDNKEQETPACFIVFDSTLNEEIKNKIKNSIAPIIIKELDEMHVPTFIQELDMIPRNIMLKVKIKDLMDIYVEKMNCISSKKEDPMILKKEKKVKE